MSQKIRFCKLSKEVPILSLWIDRFLICPDHCEISLITASLLWQDCVASHRSEYGLTDCVLHSIICRSITHKHEGPHISVSKWWDFEGSRTFFGLCAFFSVFLDVCAHCLIKHVLKYIFQ